LLGHDLIGQRSGTVRRANLSAILRVVHEHGPVSRSELVARTGLTRSAIRALVSEFVAAGLLFEERAVPGGLPGRPSPVVHPRPEAAAVLAIEIAVDSLAVAVVGLGGATLERRRVERPRGHLTVDEIVADVVGLVQAVPVLAGGDVTLIGVGVAVVGVVRRSDGWLSMAPNLGWRDVPLGARLSSALGLRLPVQVANEADLGALAELRRGAARGADDVVFLSGEVGVGGGIIVDGQPLTGVAGYAGELGHMPLNPDGLRCGCGATGCWETEVGERALLRRAGRSPDGGRVAVNELLEAAAAGDPKTLAALDVEARWLAIGIAGLVNLLNPRAVILGGLFGRLQPYVARRLERELRRRALAAPRSTLRISPAGLGIDAPLLGAAELAFEPFLSDPASWFGRRGELADAATA
jgi:predicted NBD/HSP70 family sugar kinase